MMRRLMRTGMWITAAAGLALAALLALGLYRPLWRSWGHTTAGVVAGRLEVAWGNGVVTRQPISWAVQTPVGFASVLMGRRSPWRPTFDDTTLGAGAGTPFRIAALYIPIWPWLVLAGGLTGLLWWRAGRATIPGHCRACGYDLRGLPDGRCPECGSRTAKLLSRLVAVVGGWTAPCPEAKA